MQSDMYRNTHTYYIKYFRVPPIFAFFDKNRHYKLKLPLRHGINFGNFGSFDVAKKKSNDNCISKVMNTGPGGGRPYILER
jgi:hypothetical protein